MPEETCPWCKAKGQTVTLRTYAINHEETVRLCPSPMCVFPLVSRPLEAVLASLSTTPVPTTPDQQHPGQTSSAPGSPELIEPPAPSPDSPELIEPPSLAQDAPKIEIRASAPDSPQLIEPPLAKRPRTEEPTVQRSSLTPGSPVLPDSWVQAGGVSQNPNAVKADVGQLIVSRRDEGTFAEADNRDMLCTPLEGEEMEEAIPDSEALTGAATEASSESVTCISTTDTEQDEHAEIPPNEEPPSGPFTAPAGEGASAGSGPLRSRANLTWLDSLLVAVAQTRSLRLLALGRNDKRSRGRKRKNPNQDASPVLELCASYESTSHHLTHTVSDGRRDAEKRLADLRSSTLTLLEPPLQKKRELTRRPAEVPALALSVLLELDSRAKELFQHSVQWESQCQTCGCSSSSSCTNTATAYTYLVSDCHPLSPPVQITCSRCQSINQKKILHERVPPVFAVHFLDGFPQSDVTACSFGYAESQYAPTTVIQHKAAEGVYISWCRKSDGSWIAYEDFADLRGTSHSKLDIPTKEVHMVFWEVEPKDIRQASSQHTPDDIPPPPDCQTEDVAQETITSHDLSLSTPHEDTLVAALKPSDPGSVSAMDTSISSTTLLDTFEGLSHNDILTLALEPARELQERGPIGKTPQVSPAVGETAESSVPEEAQVTTVSSPPVVRRSRRLASKQIERKDKRQNNTDQEENPEPQTEPEGMNTHPLDSSPVKNSLQNTTLFIPAGQVIGDSSAAPGTTLYIPVEGQLAQSLTTQILQLPNSTLSTLSLQNPNPLQTLATQNQSLETPVLQEPTKSASAKKKCGPRTPTKKKMNGPMSPGTDQKSQPTGTIVQNSAEPLSVANPSLLTPVVKSSDQLLQMLAYPTFSENLTSLPATTHNQTVKALATQMPTTPSLATQMPAVQVLAAQTLPVQVSGGQGLAQTSQLTHLPTVQASPETSPPQPQALSHLPPDTIITLNLDIEMDSVEPGQLQAPEISLQSPLPTPNMQDPNRPTLVNQNPELKSPVEQNIHGQMPVMQNTTQLLREVVQNPPKLTRSAIQNPFQTMGTAIQNPSQTVGTAPQNPSQETAAVINLTLVPSAVPMQHPTIQTPTMQIPTVNLTSTKQTSPPPQPSPTQAPAARPSAVDSLIPQRITPLNLDEEADFTEPDQLPEEPDLILPSVVPSHPQHRALPLPVSMETPSLVPPTPASPPSPVSSTACLSPKHKQQSMPQPQQSTKTATPPMVKLESTKTLAPPVIRVEQAKSAEVKLKPDLNKVPPVKPHLFSGFKAQQKGASSSPAGDGGPVGWLGFATKQFLSKPSLPQAPHRGASQLPPVLKTAATAKPVPTVPNLGPAATAAVLRCKKGPSPTSAAVPEDAKTATLRLKLLKKLKAKKKQLAELDQMLRQRGMVPQGCTVPPSASTASSPASASQVTSPGTPSTVSSSDGADMLDMLASGGGDALGKLMSGSALENSQNSYPSGAPSTSAPAADFLTIDDFLDDVIFDTSATEKAMENSEFDALDMFL